jgi:outer membrane protein TolC
MPPQRLPPVHVDEALDDPDSDLAKQADAGDSVFRIAVASPERSEAGLVQPAGYAEQPEVERLPETGSGTPEQPPAQLDLDSLVADVLARNPDIQSASAAWRAAAQRYPQEIALDDPVFGAMLGPGSWGSNEVGFAYSVEASQRVPWPGKRALRGHIARALANAAALEVAEERLRIAQATRLAYYQYFLADRRLAVLAESTELLKAFREIAIKKYEAAEVQQQDVLLAEVELAELERRRLELERIERVARARVNTLLLEAPDKPLPPPPEKLEVERSLPGPDELQELSLAQRPELAAQAARIRAERDAAALARKEFHPDFEFVARYDAFWQEVPLRPMVGMFVNVPVYRQKRWAAVREAEARFAEQQAELDAQLIDLVFQIEQTYRRVQESRQALGVYQERLLPTARHSVDVARASYIAGQLDFLRLVEAQRQLLSVQEGLYETMAEYHQRLAELDRQIGTPLP